MSATKRTKRQGQTTIADRIAHLEPCTEALAWASGYTSPTKAWRECVRGDWMLWLVGLASGEPGTPARRSLVRCAAACARMALEIFAHHHPGDPRVRNCLDACDAWADGQIPLSDLKDVSAAAEAAATYAATDAATAATCAAVYAAIAAADAADAADAVYAAIAAVYAAIAAADAADAAAVPATGRDSFSNTLANCADILRQHYPRPPRIRKRKT